MRRRTRRKRSPPPRPGHLPPLESAEAALRWLAKHANAPVDKQIAVFESALERFSKPDLTLAVLPRLSDLGTPEGDWVLRLVRHLDDPGLYDELAATLPDQPATVDPDRLMEGLMILSEAGCLDRDPVIRNMVQHLAADDDPLLALGEMLNHLAGSPDDAWMALEAFDAGPSRLRARAIRSLAGVGAPAGLLSLVKYVVFGTDPEPGVAALEVLGALAATEPAARDLLARVAVDHPIEVVRHAALRLLGSGTGIDLLSVAAAQRQRPPVVRAIVSEVDGKGNCLVVLVAKAGRRFDVAAFLCGAETGVKDIHGERNLTAGERDEFLDELAGHLEVDQIEGCPELARRLLADALSRSGPQTTMSLPFWLDCTVGMDLRPAPLRDDPAAGEPAADQAGVATEAALIEQLPSWFEDDDLVYDLADHRGSEPAAIDPVSLQAFFERVFQPRIEAYEVMLRWMAAIWDEAGAQGFAHRARRILARWAGPEAVRPDDPFLVALLQSSIKVARRNLDAGLDLRKAGVRASLQPGRGADDGEAR